MTTDITRSSLVYSFKPIIEDYVSQAQLEIKIISNDYDEAKETEKILKKILSMKSDTPFTTYNNITFKSYLSGGGILFDDAIQMYEDTLIFIIKYKGDR